MSFSGSAKTEVCRTPVQKPCCALAELYGILLFASTFSPQEIRIITGNEKLARRIAQLCAAQQPPIDLPFETTTVSGGRTILTLADPKRIAPLLHLFGYDETGFLTLHFHGWMVESDCCRAAFLRGAFLTGGYLAEPEKMYYLELSSPHALMMRELGILFADMELHLKAGRRKDNALLYCKDSETIETYLTVIGAHRSVINFMETRVIKDVRNTINRRVNCEASNIIKAAENGTNQLKLLQRIEQAGQTELLDDKLREAMQLRMQYPDETLAELAARANPPVSKSGLNHRLKKLMTIAETLPEAPEA